MAKDVCNKCGCCNHCGSQHESDYKCPMDPDVTDEDVEKMLADAGISKDETKRGQSRLMHALETRDDTLRVERETIIFLLEEFCIHADQRVEETLNAIKDLIRARGTGLIDDPEVRKGYVEEKAAHEKWLADLAEKCNCCGECAGKSCEGCQQGSQCDATSCTCDTYVFEEFKGHDGFGWYYYQEDYPDEDSTGAFVTELDARKHAKGDGG